MEYCNLGQLMVYNNNFDGYDYNYNLIIFLMKKIFIEEKYNIQNLRLSSKIKNEIYLIKYKSDLGKIFY